MQNRLFIENILEQQLTQEGYLTLPLLDEAILTKIREYYNSLNIINNTNCLAANIVLTEEQNNTINEYFKELLLVPLEKYFVDFTIYGASFSIKKNHHPELQLHQDPSNIDEENAIAYTIWIPIFDVNKDNGAMFLVPKSHLFFDNYISYTLPSCLIDRKLVLNRYIKTIDMKAGEALLFTNKLLHGSYINTKEQDRVIVILTITNKLAKFVYYNKKDQNTISKYIVEPLDLMNSYQDFSVGRLPKNANFDRDIKYTHKHIDTVDLYKKLLNTNNTLIINVIIMIKRVIRWLDNRN